MLPDRRAYFLALAPAALSAIQLLVRYNTLDMRVMLIADLVFLAIISCAFTRKTPQLFLLVLTLIAALQNLLTALLYEPNLLRLVHHTVLYIFFPFFLAHSYARYSELVFVRMATVAGLALAGLNLLILPFELTLRGGIQNIYALQFSGRSYELISILLVAMTIATINRRRSNGPLAVALFVSTSLTFSRGGIAIVSLVLASTWWRHLKLFFSRYVLVLLLFAIIGGFLFSRGTLDALISFWVVRLNFDSFASNAENISSFFDGFGRWEIWLIGFDSILERPIWGTGVATSSQYISDATGGLIAFSGYHNLSLTILAERGIPVGFMFLLLLLIILHSLLFHKSYHALIYFVGFLVFSHTTGGEFVLDSYNYRNANVLFFVFLLYLRLKCMRKAKRVPVSNLPTGPQNV